MQLPGFKYDGKLKRAVIEYTVPGTEGKKRRRRWLKGVTRDEALAAWKKLRGADEEPPPAVWTFGRYVKEYWPAIAARVKPATARNEGYVLRKWLVPRFGEMPLERVNAAELRDLTTHLKASKLSPWSINGITGLLLRILRDAVDREVIPANPVRGRVKKERTEILRLELSPEEQAAFLRAFEDREGFGRWLAAKASIGPVIFSERFATSRRFGGPLRVDSEAAEYYFERFQAAGPLFVLALETGLRRGDLLALTWSQVDLEAGWIRLVTSKRREPAVIAISSRCRAALEDLRDRPRREEGAPADFRRRSSSRPVCVDLEGEPYSVTTVRRYFATSKELAGISRRLRFHDLRHTFASDLVTAGIPEAWIRKAMGQRDDRSLRRYAKTRDEGLKAIAAALDRKLP
jgi:integrase